MKMKDTNEKQPEETDQQSYTDSQPETETDATTAKLPEYFSILKSATIIQYTIKGRFMSR